MAFAILLLKQLLDRGVVSADGQPWEGCRGEGTYGDSGAASHGRDGHSKPSRPIPQLHALVLTRNRDITTRVLVGSHNGTPMPDEELSDLPSKGPRHHFFNARMSGIIDFFEQMLNM